MKKNIRKLSESFLHAFRGLRLCIHDERNFRVHMTAAFYVILFGVFGGVSMTEAAILCICFGLTMGAELLNTAIERLCDKQASGYDGMVRNAKDIAAAGVFVCAAACVAVGACIFIGNGVLAAAIKFLWYRLWRLWSPCRLRFGSFFILEEFNNNGEWKMENSRKDSSSQRGRNSRKNSSSQRGRNSRKNSDIFNFPFSILNYCTGDK